jgi:hypothetical protein
MLGPRFEKGYPFCFGLVSAIATLPQMPWVSSHRPLLTAFVVKLFPPALNIGAIAVGFLATSQSILISLKDSKGIAQMKEHGYHEPFVNFLSSATSLSFALAIASAVFSALDFSRFDQLHSYLICAWTFVCVWTLLAYYRAVSLLPFVLRGAVPRCAKRNPTMVPFDRDK